MLGFLLTLAVSNWIGIIVAAIAAMIVGFIWYSPKLFGNKWMKLQGINQKDAAKMMKNPAPMVMLFIGAIISATVLQIFFTNLNVLTLMKAVEVAVGVWIFIAVSSFGMTMMSRKSTELWMIQAVHLLVGIIVTGIVLVLI